VKRLSQRLASFIHAGPRFALGCLARGLRRPVAAAVVCLGVAGVAHGADPEPMWPPEDGRLLDRLVAVVNSEPVTLFELQRAAAPNLSQVMRETRDPAEREARLKAVIAEALDQLVDDILVYAQASEMDLTVAPEKVDEHIRKIRDANGWTEDELAAELQKLGFASIADYRRHTEREMLKSQVIGIKVVARVKVDEADVDVEYQRQINTAGGIEERRAAHILIRLPESAGADEEAKARETLLEAKRQVEAGELSFGDAARKYSQDGTRNAGGDLGWFVRGDYDPAFEDVAFSVAKGKLSEPFRTTFGMHLVTVTDSREKKLTAPKDAETVKRQILFRLREKQIERLYKQWVKGLRGDAYVEIKDLGLDK